MKAFVCAAMLALATSVGLAQDKSSAQAQPVAGTEETIKMSAKVTAIDHAKRVVKDGMRCRATEFTTSAGGERGASTWNLCKTKDGWKVAQ